MTFGDVIRKLESTPSFKTLTYDEQVEARSIVMQKYINLVPSFYNLNPQEQAGFSEKVLYREPVFQNKNPNPDWAKFKYFADKGDSETALQLAQSTVVGEAFVENFGLANLIKGLGFSIASVVTGKDALLQDYNKMASYFEAVTNNDKRYASMTNNLKNLVGGVASVIDIASMYSGIVGTLEKPVGLVSKMMQGVTKFDKYSRFGTKILGALTHSLGGGFVGLVREGVKDWATSEYADNREVFSNAAAHFGEYFAGDLLFFAGAGILKNVAHGLGWAFPQLQRFKMFQNIPEVITGTGGFQRIDKLISGELIPKNPQDAIEIMGKAINSLVDSGQYRAIKEVSPLAAKIIDEATHFGTVMKNVEKLSQTDVFRLSALAGNHLVEQVDNGFKITSLLDNKNLGTFNTIDDGSKAIIDNINKIGNSVKQTAKDIKTIGAGMETAQVREVITGSTFKDIKNNDDILVNIIAPRSGKLNPERVTTFTRGYLSGFDIDEGIINSVKATIDGDKISLSILDNEIARVSKNLGTGLNEREAVEQIVKGLDDFIPEEAVLDRLKREDFLSRYVDRVKQQELFTPSWIEDTAPRFYEKFTKNSDGTFTSLKEGVTKNFKNLNDVGYDIVKNDLTPSRLQEHLRSYEGIKLNILADDSLELIKKGKFKERFANVDDLLTKHPEFMPKISDELAPKFAFVDRSKNVQFVNQTVTGNYQDLLRELNKFDNYRMRQSEIKLYAGDEGVINVNNIANEFEVYLPEYGYRETFKSKQKAIEFLKENHNNFADLKNMAFSKGYILEASAGKFLIYSDVATYTAQNIDELKQVLRDAPLPKYMPEITGVPKDIMEGMEKPVKFNWKPKDYAPMQESGRMGPGWYANQFLGPTDRQLLKATEQGFLGEGFLKGFRAMEDVRQVMDGQNMKMSGGLEAAFMDFSGKTSKIIRDRKTLVELGRLLEAPVDMWDDIVKGSGILQDKHKQIATTIRDYVNDLGGAFTVTPDKWLGEYLPRMRKVVNGHGFKASNYTDGMMFDFLKDTLGMADAKKMEPFFKHARVSDVINYIKEDNPMISLTKYIIAGNKERYLGPMLDDLTNQVNNFFKENSGKLGAGQRDALQRMVKYISDIGGMPKPTFERKQLAGAFTATLNKLGFDKAGSVDFVAKVTQLSYAANMSYRAWLPIRNMHQVLTTLGPRIGNTYVDDAIKLLRNDDGTIYRQLKEKGVFQMDTPVAGGQFLGGEGKLQKFAKKGLKWYRNSDEYTRAVAYMAAEGRFQRALDYWDVTSKKFWEQSGTSLMDSDLQNQIKNLLSKGDNEAAKYVFANNIVRETMFVYKPGMSNVINKGSVLGTLFSQYGHYSMWYRSNFMRGVTQGTLKQKASFLARWAGNGLALAGLYGSIGVGAANFLPWSPMIFNGGPYYDLVNNLLQATEAGYSGNAARKRLLNLDFSNLHNFSQGLLNSQLFLSIAPTSYQFRSLVRGLARFNKGDYYRGILDLTSAPVVEDNPWEYYANRDLIFKQIWNSFK